MERKNVELLTEYIKTKDINTIDEEEKQFIVQKIRQTLPDRRGLVDAIKPYIKDFDQLSDFEKETIIISDERGVNLLDQIDLTLKELQFLEDEDYYVDLEEEANKDLYAKQRVVDQFLKENEEERKDLLGYYENLYYKAQPNKFVHIVYANSFNLNRVRMALSMGLFNTALATVCLGMINPFLPAILLYDYYKLAQYSLMLNGTVIRMRISKTKQRIFIERLNLFGYWKKPKQRWEYIRHIKYISSYENTSVNPNSIGWIPSLLKIRNLVNKYILKKVKF